MLPSTEVVALSRWQFGLTASFHFLFVPLTLGLAWILVIMESVYVLTGKQIYKDMTQFWGKLFGINFAMAVLSGITLEFQFGQNWAYFSQYIGDVFGVPLAVEGLSAFMLESALFGIFFFGWNKISKTQHLVATVFLAIGTNLSALVILVANGWMQHPIGSYFNYKTMRMELSSWTTLWLNPDAQVRFVHTLASGYTTASMFVLGISAYYLLKGRDLPFAKRSFAVASGFGLAAVLSVLVLGDANGLAVGHMQAPKMAAIEAVWDTPKAPAAWTLFALPDQQAHKNHDAIDIPWGLSLIATHSLDGTVIGINQIIHENEQRIRNGMKAYGYLQQLRQGNTRAEVTQGFERYKDDLGYGLLLKRFTPEITNASDAQIKMAAEHSVPNVSPLFWTFRVMVGLGFLMLLIFAFAFVHSVRFTVWRKRWFLRLCVYAIPLPWIATECGWFVAEHGRQPWTVYGLLPTTLSTSSIAAHDVIYSLIGMMGFFMALFLVELYLMFKYARLGPSTLHSGRYHFEQTQ